MEPKHQSEQERFVREFSRHSLGAPHIFIPTKWGREPADIAWFSNNTCVLMYLSEASDVREAIKHNLKQAKGALRYWRMGKLLSGQNEYNNFSTAIGDVKHLIVLSVIRSSGSMAEYHSDFARDEGISACCTIPHSVLHRFAAVCCTMVDLIGLLNTLKHESALHELDVHKIMTLYLMKCAKEAAAPAYWDFGKDPSELPGYYESMAPLLHARHESGEPSHSILNDFSFGDTLRIAMKLHESLKLSSDLNFASTTTIALSRYDCGLCVVRNLMDAKSQEFARNAFKAWDGGLLFGKLREGPRIVFDPAAEGLLYQVVPRVGISTTEELLDRLFV